MPDIDTLDASVDEIINRKKSKLTATGYAATDTNTEREAGLRLLAKQANVPVEATYSDDGAEAKRMITANKLELLPSHAPRTAEFLSDAERMKVSHDDIEGLSLIEKAFDKVKRGARSVAASAYSTSEGLWGIAQAGGEALDALNIPYADDIAAIARGGREAAGEMASKVRGDNSKAGFIEGSIYQGLESFGGNLLMAPATIMTGSPTPMLAGMSLSTGGKSYGEAREKGVSPLQSAIHGTSQGAIEYATEMIPAARFVEAMNGKTLLSKALKSVLGPDIVGEQVATVFQDLNDWATLNPEKSMKEYLDERPSAAAQTLIATVVGTGGMVATAKGLQTAGQSFEKQMQARQQADFLIALGEGVKASKTFARLPENVKELVRLIKQDGEVQDLYVPVEKVNQLFQSKGMDPAQQMDQILADPSRYHEANATGGDVAIPLEDFAALAGDEIYGELIADARTHIDGLSLNEAKQFDTPEMQAEFVNHLLAETEDDIPTFETETEQTAYQSFYDDTYGQLVGIGRNPDQADKESQIRAKMLTTLMQRGGYSADYLSQMFPVTITRGPVPEALQKPKGADAIAYEAQIGGMLDRLRAGKVPGSNELFGPSLLDFLRDKGLKDEGGELGKMDLNDGRKFKKKLVRDDGVPLDRAREAAQEAGYLQEGSTVADLLDAIDKEMRGSSVYSAQFGNQAAQDEALSLQQLQQWVDDMGIDLATADNAKLLQLMQGSVAGGVELNQVGSAAFNKWFGDSKVVDKDGNPLVVYHGPGNVFTEFGDGANFFSDDRSVAEGYAEDGIDVIEAYLSINNPMIVSAPEGLDRNEENHVFEEAKKKGHDGVIIEIEGANQYITFSPTQVKSATSNQGTFDPQNPNILFQSASIEELKNDKSVFWHGSPSGSLVGAKNGIHVGSYRAAEEALNSRIGIPAEGYWDGSREYGKTLLAGKKRMKEMGEYPTGYNTSAPEEDYYPTDNKYRAKYSGGDEVDFKSKPVIAPLRIKGEMSNTVQRTMSDTRANAQMKAQITKGNAKKGYFYINDGEDAGSVSAVVPNKSHLEEITTNGEYFLYQQKRGYIQFTPGVPGFEIALLKDADVSTFTHELGHYYFEVLGTLAGQEGAPAQIVDDYNSLLKWLGAESKQALTVRQQEQLADGFLAYLAEGNAPSEELRGVFSRFKTWLKAIYASIRNADVKLTNEVRQIFDRWLATDEEIEAARNQSQAKPMFASPETAGMSPRVFDAYRKLAEDAHESAKSRLDAMKYKEANRAYQDWWKEALAGITAEVEKEAKENPVYEVLNVIRNGELFDGTKYEGEVSRINGSALKQMYDSDTLKAFAKKLGPFYVNEGGINPHDMAEMFGFGSADEMVRKMVEAPKMREWVKAEAERRMMERYPEKNSAEIAEAALAAVNNDDLAKVLREELKAIDRKRRDVRKFTRAEEQDKRDERKEAFSSIPPLAFFKEAAKQRIASMKVMDIKPGLYARAEAKAGKEAIEQNGKGNFAEAAAAKQRQLLNHYLYREATEAKERADKTLAYMRKLESGKKQSALGKAGQEYLDQINNILDQYEFRRIPLRDIAARESLLDWIERKEQATGQKFPIDPGVLADAEQVNYRTLTVGVLDEIYKTAKLIDFLATNHNKLLKDEQKRDLRAIGQEVAASIEINGGKAKKRNIEKKLLQDQPGNIIKNYLAGMRAMSSLAREMDGGQDGGLVWQSIIRPLNEAGDNEAELHAKATATADKIFSVYSHKERMTMTMRKMVPGTDVSLSHWGRLMVVLNMGNEGNIDRLRATFSDQEIRAVLDSLDERDLRFVQNVWDWMESFKPMIAAKEKRVNGIEPDWVTPSPLPTKHGTLTGGYFPIFYDQTESPIAEAYDAKTIEQQMNGGMFSHAATRRGHLEARLEHIDRPLDFDIGNIFNHVNQVIHDLTHHEVLLDLNKVLALDSIKDAMRDYYGPEAYRIFRDGVTDVAVGTIPARNAWEWWAQYTRIGATTAALGWNITTSLLQPLGLTQSIVRIGPEWVARGVKTWLGSPKKMYDEIPSMIYEKSKFMKHRAQSMNRELAEVSGKIKPGIVPHVIKDSYFFLIQEMQKVVDIPTWLGQYEKSMAAHGNEADAVAEADQAVIDAQAHGQQKDLSRFQRGGPFAKLFTMFSSYFVRTWNLAAESYGATNFKDVASVGKFTVDMMLIYVFPAAISSAVFDVAIQAAIGGDPDEDKFWMGFFSKTVGGVIAPLPGINQLASLTSGYLGYEGPAGTRVYSEISKLAKQVGQGESDWALWKSVINTGGVLLHAPSGQVVKSIGGLMEMTDGNGNALSLLFGKPKK